MISRFAADEPDISAKDIEENVEHVLGSKVSTRYRRRKVRVSLASFTASVPVHLPCSRFQKVLSVPKKAAKYTFDTHNIYTFHTYDDGEQCFPGDLLSTSADPVIFLRYLEAMDYGMGTMHIPMYGEYDIKPSIGHQPLSLTAVTTAGVSLAHKTRKPTLSNHL